MWLMHAKRAEEALRRRAEFLAAIERESGTAAFDHFAAMIIYTELVDNVIRHANGPLDVQLRCEKGRAIVQVYDHGAGFELRPELPMHAMQEDGRGLFLIRQYSDEMKVQTMPRYGTCVSAIFPL